jgi:Beta xylosidase C-terminal Concanavalin A-like domain
LLRVIHIQKVGDPLLRTSKFGPSAAVHLCFFGLLLVLTPLAWAQNAPVSDDFHSTTLNTSLWTYVNPRSDSPLTMNGTNALISVPGGINHELWTNVTTAPRLMQNIGNVSFQVEAKFDLGLAFQTHGAQEEGIMVQQDPQNFIRFAVFSETKDIAIYVATFAAGQPTQVTYTPVSLANGQVPLWIRVSRSGNSWTFSWSTNGSTYTTSSTFNYTLTTSQIGPYVGNAGDSSATAPAFNASIDYFFNTASPIVPEDGGVDIIPTAVSVAPTATGATVTWTTSDWSSSLVNYGTTSSYGSSVSNASLVTSHSLAITGLNCATTYHYQVTSADYAGSAESSTDATFLTSACTTGGPIISGVSVTPASTSATVAWTTSTPASSRVDYGLSTSYTVTDSNSSLVTAHSLALTSLACATTYHYKITSVDGSSNTATTTDSTFTTTACSTAGAPVSDDFTGSTLNPIWSFYASCCGFQKMTGTDVLLTVPSVTNHNIYALNQGAGLIQQISNVDFDVVAKFDSPVTQGVQEQGIVVQQDAQNFLYFAIYHDGVSPTLLAVDTVAGNPTLKLNNAISFGGAPFWLRVTRSGSTWTERWSTDGTNYTTGVTFTQSLTTTGIGPVAANNVDDHNNPAPSFTAAVDYFFNLASPISPTDGGTPAPANQPAFNIWYGDSQSFGQNGTPQQWVNVLGNVSAPSGIQSASYTLNGGAAQFLRIGPNGARLNDTGDFNVEIDHTTLLAGVNTVVISATDNQNHTTSHTVTMNYTAGKVWPLPYSIDWSTVTNIQNVAQIIDGQWKLQSDGTVRTMQVGYDRLITLGDVSWTDYQLTAEITVNTLDCTDFSFGVVVGWTGHTTDPTQPQPDQPRTGHPFFGFGSYATTGNQVAPNAELNIYANSVHYPEKVLIQDASGFMPVPGVKYIMKFAVQRNSGGATSHYSLKMWPATGTEPANWLLQADADPSTGSIVLAAHRSDVSFGKVTVVSLP